jgi:hypothetical protein
MEPRILIKHLQAAKSGQVEEFPVDKKRELIIGRDPNCDLKFDPNDDLVSRRLACDLFFPQPCGCGLGPK